MSNIHWFEGSRGHSQGPSYGPLPAVWPGGPFGMHPLHTHTPPPPHSSSPASSFISPMDPLLFLTCDGKQSPRLEEALKVKQPGTMDGGAVHFPILSSGVGNVSAPSPQSPPHMVTPYSSSVGPPQHHRTGSRHTSPGAWSSSPHSLKLRKMTPSSASKGSFPRHYPLSPWCFALQHVCKLQKICKRSESFDLEYLPINDQIE